MSRLWTISDVVFRAFMGGGMGLHHYIGVCLAETTAKSTLTRTPEPELITEDLEHVEAFSVGGEEGGAILPLYQLHLERLSRIIRPGNRVLDLGCGSGQLLAMAAQVFPEAQFVGVDLSVSMLNSARQRAGSLKLTNLTFIKDSMSHLGRIDSDSFDVVTSSLAMHHLPDETELDSTFFHINRVLRVGGGILLTDFGLLRSPRSLDHLTAMQKKTQPAQLVEDYEHSLKAAFSAEAWQNAARHLVKTEVRLRQMPLASFLIQMHSPFLDVCPGSRKHLKEFKKRLGARHKLEFALLKLTLS